MKMQVVMIVLLVILYANDAFCVLSAMFYRKNPCSTPGHFSSENTTNIGSCTQFCLGTKECEAFRYSKHNGDCFLHDRPFADDGGCQDTSIYYIKDHKCLHGGSYDVTIHTCHCKDSYVGERCERLMEDCSDGAQYPYYAGEDGTYIIHPQLSPAPLTVYCQMKWGGRTFIQNRWSQKKLFEKGWNKYKNGFGVPGKKKDFWLGNTNIYYLTNVYRFKLLVQVSNNDFYRQSYLLGFKLGDESKKFRLMFDGHQNATDPDRILGDCFQPLLNASFSTPDRDNDENPNVDCGSLRKAGWWFRGPECAVCNPNGYLTTQETRPGNPEDAFYTPTLGNRAINRMFMSIVRSNE